MLIFIMLIGLSIGVKSEDISAGIIKLLEDMCKRYVNQKALRVTEDISIISPMFGLRMPDPVPGTPEFNLKCHCERSTCTCCVNVVIDGTQFREKVCFKMTFYPEYNANHVRLIIDQEKVDQIIVTEVKSYCPLRKVPSKPHYCLHFSNATRMRNVMGGPDRLDVCLNVTARLERSILFVVHYGCIHIGGDEFGFWRPIQVNTDNSDPTGTRPVPLPMPQEVIDQILNKDD